MPIVSEDWDTKSNQEAQGSGIRGRQPKTPNLEVVDGDVEPQQQAQGPLPQQQFEEDPDDPGLSDAEIINLIKNAHSQAVSYQTTILQPRWNAAYLAFNNKHTSDSKYMTPRWRGRTRLFRPKTRSTARKKSAEAAQALFSTSDVVLVSAQNPSDKLQQASAAIIHELLNFRLDRSSENAGIPWFATAMGAHLSALQTGCCISKQYWEYKQEFVGYEDVPDPNHQPLDLNMLASLGMDTTNVVEMPPPMVRQKKFKMVKDRPVCRLYPAEDCLKDPGADWTNQAQDSSYLILKNPMALREAREFLKNNNEHSALQFIEVPDAELKAAVGASQGDSGMASSTRRAREQAGNDRYNDQAVDTEFRTVWLHENFMRINDKDYVFWTLGVDRLVSNIVPVSKAYPEQGGARPVTIGVSAIEPFKIDPMSPVESWQPLQQEINDLVNLTLDATKQSVSPLTLVKRGRSVDIKAIQNRSPDTVAYVQDPKTDVVFDRPTGPSGESAMAIEKLNADFDDEAGNFSLSSVQTNRQLGDTVGGMKLANNTASAMGEYDLRVWIESWVEVVLRQLVKLIQFYESDENIIAIAAGKAKLMQKFGHDAVTNSMLTSQVVIICNVGLGSADPMMGLQKFAEATKIVGGMLGQERFQKEVKRDEVINEVYGKAGYKDAAERFFEPTKGDPRLQEAQNVMQQMQGALGEAEKAVKDKQGDIVSKEKIAKGNNDTQVKLKKMDIFGKMLGEQLGHKNSLEQQQAGHEQGMEAADQGAFYDNAAAEQQAQLNPKVPGAPGAMPAEGGDDEGQLVAMLQQMQQQKADAGMQQAQVIAQAVQQSNAQLAAAMNESNKALLTGMQQIMQGMVLGFSKLAEDKPGDTLLQGFEAMVAKMDEIGANITATMVKIAEAPRDIVHGKDGRATGVKLNMGAAA